MALVVLVAFALVLAAAGSFAAGIAMSRTSDTLVYLSIIFSVAAFVVLAVASIRSRSGRGGAREDAFAAARLEALERDVAAQAEVRAARRSRAKHVDLRNELDPSKLDLGLTFTQEARSRWHSAAQATDELVDENEPVGDLEKGFRDHVAKLRNATSAAKAPDHMPPLPAEELTMLFAPEPEEELTEGPQGDPLEDDVLDVLESESEPEPELDELDIDVDLTDDEVPPVYAADDVDDDLRDPIDDYDDLTAAEILPQLKALDAAELQWVWDRESSGGNRPAILAQVERLMVSSGGTSPAPARRAPATRPATKKAAPKKAATKKAAAKKAAPKKALKKTAAKSRTAKKTPAKKTARSRRA